MPLGLSLNLASLNNEPWSPKLLPELKAWFRFKTGITVDADGDVLSWRSQGGVYDLTAEADGSSNVSPDLQADGTILFNSA